VNRFELRQAISQGTNEFVEDANTVVRNLDYVSRIQFDLRDKTEADQITILDEAIRIASETKRGLGRFTKNIQDIEFLLTYYVESCNSRRKEIYGESRPKEA